MRDPPKPTPLVIEHLATHHKIVVGPAANGKQNQSPVELEPQTLIKGVGSIMTVHVSLGASWWCYAVESWIGTANCRPHSASSMENLYFTSSQELITSTAPNLNTNFLFPFGCPVIFVKPRSHGEAQGRQLQPLSSTTRRFPLQFPRPCGPTNKMRCGIHRSRRH